MQRRILIVGGSTRAAADSVRRAGVYPICADYFADLDLRRTAEVIPIRNYPHSIPEDVAHLQADGWFYCGALENYPEMIERIVKTGRSLGPLLGTPPEVLRRVRDPVWLMKALQSADLPYLEVVDDSLFPTPDGTWLQKPIASAGGRMIRVWDEANSRIPFPEPCCFQRRVFGIGISAIFRVEKEKLEWLGASRELNGNSTSNQPTTFSYCGSIGPLEAILNERRASVIGDVNGEFDERRFPSSTSVAVCEIDHKTLQHKLTKIAKAIVENADGLHGIFGIDCRLDGNDVWLTEVNPRYTASVDVLELATGRSLIDLDCQITSAGHPRQIDSSPRVIAKQILYAGRALTVPDLGHFSANEDPWRVPMLSDIPIPGSKMECGWPMCTVMAEGINEKATLSALHDRVTLIESLLAEHNE